MTRAARAAVAGVALALLGAIAVPGPTRADDDYPEGYRGYHTYAEAMAVIRAVAAAHPDIVRVVPIGSSARGRTLVAVKVSDHVGIDEPEPEVLFEGLAHGNEPMGLEMTLAILGWLTDGYGDDPRITRIVDGRETWIVPALNPDGQRYDFASGRLRDWRRNRQPTPGTPWIGTDLNRNFGYRWGGVGASGDPRSSRYRGPAPFSAPEARALRDFVAGRVVDGRQQIRASIAFHEFGRLVMWPYAYTWADVPPDMTAEDRAALARIGGRMAAASGYTPIQASDLYPTTGSSRDWLYGRYRVFAYTVELSPRGYLRDTRIASETWRNREAVLGFLEQAWCPLAVLGAAVREERCGAFDDDLEVARGWAVDPDGTDTAPAAGRWVRADPARTRVDGITLQPGRVPSGRAALVTGAPAGSRPGAYDLDGTTTIRSTPIALPAAAGQRLAFRWLLAHPAGSSGPADRLRAIIEGPDGSKVVTWERHGTAEAVPGAWRSASVSLDAWAGQVIRVRFEAADGGAASLVEAGIDDVRVTRPAG